MLLQHGLYAIKCVFTDGMQTLELSMSSVVSGVSELSLGELPMESWMSHLPCALWDTPLYHLAIPGRLPYNITL